MTVLARLRRDSALQGLQGKAEVTLFERLSF